GEAALCISGERKGVRRHLRPHQGARARLLGRSGKARKRPDQPPRRRARRVLRGAGQPLPRDHHRTLRRLEEIVALLFEPIELRRVKARNRIVVSPMCQYSARDGHVTDWHLVHLGKFAQGGAGIVFVEATAVEARGRITHGDTGIWDDAHVAGLARIAAFVKSQGALPAMQLAHAGRKASMARPWHGNGPLTDADLAGGERAWDIVAPTSEPLGDGWLRPRPIGERDEDALLHAY